MKIFVLLIFLYIADVLRKKKILGEFRQLNSVPISFFIAIIINNIHYLVMKKLIYLDIEISNERNCYI